MISLPYFSRRHTQKAVTSVPHKKSLGLIALTCFCFEEPLRCAGLVFNVSPLEAAYSCSALLPTRNQLSLWLDSAQTPHNPVYSQVFQHGAIFKHASVPSAHTRNLSAATASTYADRFGTVLFPQLFPHVEGMWSWRTTEKPTDMTGGGHVLIQMLHHSYNPMCDAYHRAHGTAQHDGPEDANLPISMTAEPLENVNISSNHQFHQFIKSLLYFCWNNSSKHKPAF